MNTNDKNVFFDFLKFCGKDMFIDDCSSLSVVSFFDISTRITTVFEPYYGSYLSDKKQPSGIENEDAIALLVEFGFSLRDIRDSCSDLKITPFKMLVDEMLYEASQLSSFINLTTIKKVSEIFDKNDDVYDKCLLLILFNEHIKNNF